MGRENRIWVAAAWLARDTCAAGAFCDWQPERKKDAKSAPSVQSLGVMRMVGFNS